MRIAAIVHVYYIDLWAELSDCLKNVDDCDLFVTYSDDAVPPVVRRDFPAARLMKCANVGFDIWPFLSVLDVLDLSAYDLVLKLHTKRDISFSCRLHGKDMRGSVWRSRLLSFVRTSNAWCRALSLIERDPSVGIIGDVDCILSRRDMGRSERQTFDLAVETAGEIWGTGCDFRRARYVGGTMFLARSAVFRRLQGRYEESDFDRPCALHGETFAHRFERLFGFGALAAGLRVTDLEDSIDSLRVRSVFMMYESWDWLKDLFWQDKITAKGHHLIKILKIPVWHAAVKDSGR